MKSRTVTTIGIITAFLMAVSGAEPAFARGGKGQGTGVKAGAPRSQGGWTHQYRYKQQNQYQYRHDKDTSTAHSGNNTRQGTKFSQGSKLNSEPARLMKSEPRNNNGKPY